LNYINKDEKKTLNYDSNRNKWIQVYIKMITQTHIEKTIIAEPGSTHLQSQLLRSLRQEYHEFQSNLGNLTRLCLKIKAIKRLEMLAQ
jgi:hypothetical protein